ncbi:hypothetical protein BGX31_001920 [Mortierella sp. GBA43]|nr:hypothetical protein BGX31_001920 [Mortierella sp. GBA43]
MNDKMVVPFLTDENLENLKPLRIAHHPGVVLRVLTLDDIQSGSSAMRCASSSNDRHAGDPGTTEIGGHQGPVVYSRGCPVQEEDSVTGRSAVGRIDRQQRQVDEARHVEQSLELLRQQNDDVTQGTQDLDLQQVHIGLVQQRVQQVLRIDQMSLHQQMKEILRRMELLEQQGQDTPPQQPPLLSLQERVGEIQQKVHGLDLTVQRAEQVQEELIAQVERILQRTLSLEHQMRYHDPSVLQLSDRTSPQQHPMSPRRTWEWNHSDCMDQEPLQDQIDEIVRTTEMYSEELRRLDVALQEIQLSSLLLLQGQMEEVTETTQQLNQQMQCVLQQQAQPAQQPMQQQEQSAQKSIPPQTDGAQQNPGQDDQSEENIHRQLKGEMLRCFFQRFQQEIARTLTPETRIQKVAGMLEEVLPAILEVMVLVTIIIVVRPYIAPWLLKYV